ncbi:MAG TPA: EAL domain-containing protein [Roseomonas sp.]
MSASGQPADHSTTHRLAQSIREVITRDVVSVRREFLDQAETQLVCMLQPIVECHAGALYGVEALTRGFERLGFGAPFALLDHAAELGVLCELECLLHRKAITAFQQVPEPQQRRLFLNLDGRSIVRAPGGRVLDAAARELLRHGLPVSNLCIELSERHETVTLPGFQDMLLQCRKRGMRFAADDFGRGYSEIRLLFDGGIDYIKIDHFLIDNLAGDPRKRLFVGRIAAFAHMLGLLVIAEGVETEADFLVARELGCDLIQGYYVAPPCATPDAVLPVYARLLGAVGKERRRRSETGDIELLLAAIERLETVERDDHVERVFEIFRRSDDQSIVPVVDRVGSPKGVVRERDLRALIYGRFGRDLMQNPNTRSTVASFLVECPIASVHADADTLLRIFGSAPPGCDGLLLHDAGRYIGFISAGALVGLLHEKRLRLALDQNPLTRLPGNLSVAAHAVDASTRSDDARYLCYLDFDHFKPFNDRYGFRVGDRAIILFAEAMQRHFPEREGVFLGHIGGDDFFIGARGSDIAEFEARIRTLLDDFTGSAALFYQPQERREGRVPGKDREGQERFFPLLRCSAAILEIAAGQPGCDPDRLLTEVARLKSIAKASEDGVAWATLELAQIQARRPASDPFAPQG